MIKFIPLQTVMVNKKTLLRLPHLFKVSQLLSSVFVYLHLRRMKPLSIIMFANRNKFLVTEPKGSSRSTKNVLRKV